MYTIANTIIANTVTVSTTIANTATVLHAIKDSHFISGENCSIIDRNDNLLDEIQVQLTERKREICTPHNFC